MSEPADGRAKLRWRYRAGLTVFALGHVVLGAGLLAPALGLGGGIAGVLLVAAEIICASSIFFLGKQGFLDLKSRIFAIFKLTPRDRPIGKVRHSIGVSLLVINFLAIYVAAAMVIIGFFRVTAEDPFPLVWWMSFEQQGFAFIAILAGGEVAFVAAVYVLGAEWWSRFTGLFRWPGAKGAGPMPDPPAQA